MQELSSNSSSTEAEALLARLGAFCFPGGEDAARLVRGIRTTQKGELRMSPEARWIPFTAEEFIDATRSNFRWQACLDPGKISSPTVTDAYEEGHGRLVVKIAGVVPVKKIAGPDADKGKLQRYLASIVFCPPILLNHASLECTAIGPLTLRVRDRNDSTGATVDLDISEAGQPLTCRADRPRIVGKQVVMTPWSGTCAEFREWEGLRVATSLDVRWHLAGGPIHLLARRDHVLYRGALRREHVLAGKRRTHGQLPVGLRLERSLSATMRRPLRRNRKAIPPDCRSNGFFDGT